MLARCLRRVLLIAVLAGLAIATPAAAEPEGFAEAEEAWKNADLDGAQTHYQVALDRGGLEPADVLVAYSRIGTVRAAAGDTQGALSAFRVATAIDPTFQLPEDSGPVAHKLYAQALSEAAEQGQALQLEMTAPEELDKGQPFTVETRIPEGFAVFVAKVVITVEDTLTGKKWRKKMNAEPELSFEFPGRIATKGARLAIKASAVDAQDNAWVVARQTAKVAGEREDFDWGEGDESGDEAARKAKKDGDKGGDLLSGPIPWIAGGALLVGGILVFALTRPSDMVTVGAPKWE